MYRVYRFADIDIGVNFTYDFIDRQCEKYLSDGLPEHIITITSEKIDYERSLNGENGAGFPDGYFESLAFHREFVTWAVDKQVLLMHGSTIAFDGKAYMYTAPSGTGKSTHSHICSKVFGDRVFYINDDKPFLRRVDGQWRAYGSPWDGKHRLSTNCSAPLGGICFLRRGDVNEIHRADKFEKLGELMGQIYRPDDVKIMKSVMPLIISLASTPLWELHCNISADAAKLSLGTMSEIYEER